MRPVRRGERSWVAIAPLIGFGCLLGLLAVLASTIGLNAPGWAAGVASGAVLAALLAGSLARHRARLGPADWVTLARAVIVCGVAALAADWFGSGVAPVVLVVLSMLAMVLDGIDGRVARRTGTASQLGARFDFEVDAFLILVLSVFVAGEWGWWVIPLGLARYWFVAAGRVFPWLRADPPPRQWGKVAAVIVGVVLTVAAAGILPDTATFVALLVSLCLLAESFGRSLWTMWRLGGGRPFPRATATGVLAALLVWAALLVPDRFDDLAPSVFLRIPVEGLVFVAIVLVLPLGLARYVALLVGLGLGGLTILRLLDMGFQFAFDIPFHPVYHTAYAGSTLELLSDSIGGAAALVVLVGAGVLVVALLTLLPLSALRLTRLVGRHRRQSVSLLALLSAVAMVTAWSGAQLGPAGPMASTASAQLVITRALQVRDDLSDQREFVRALGEDSFDGTPADDLLTGLRGKDVLLVFVESYGRTALDLPAVESALAAGQRRLAQAGFSSSSGFLTSPTFGGASWLAHITLQSGVWVDNQRVYDHLVTLDRLTLADAFGRAGWRTVAGLPANQEDWPVATTYYHFDHVWDSRNMGYAGPRFSWASMPDQYILAAFQRLELEQAHRVPVMAEIDLVSSHGPWAPLPRLVDWSLVGDGSVFNPMPAEGNSPEEVWRDPDRVKASYAESIAYSLDAVTSFVEQYHDPELVLVVLGDHQPASIISGAGASRDVPVSIIAADPAVVDRASDWGWQDGLRPDADAPVWPMDAFRDKFLTMYGGSQASPG